MKILAALAPLALLALLTASFLGSCSSDTYQKLPMPPQDVRVSSPDVARIYVAREAVRGTLFDIKVTDGRTEVGTIAKDEYLCWERLPGRGLIVLVYKGPKVDGGDIEGLLPIECEAGEVYFYSLEIESSYSKPFGTLLSEVEGRALIADRDPAHLE